MKRIVFLIIASLLVIGLVLPSVVAAQTTTIEVIIAGPMTGIQGLHMWYGAQLANSEIGTFSDGGTDYEFHLNQVDTKEISNPPGAGAILDTALTATGAKLVIGGFRTEGTETMIPKAIAANATMFICGSASYSLLSAAFVNAGHPTYSWTYDEGYKYIFRGTPFNEIFLLNNCFQMLGMVTTTIKMSGVASPKVAIVAESLTWADSQVALAEGLIQSPLALDCTLGPVWRISDTGGASDVLPALNDIKAENCHVIFTLMSGPVGTVFSTQKGRLEIPAIAVGINVPAQDPEFWDGTLGNCAYEIALGTTLEGVTTGTGTAAFITAFKAAYGTNPIYTASSYDILKGMAEAIKDEGYNPADLDPLILWYEDPANAQPNTSGTSAYYPRWDGHTTGSWGAMSPIPLPALNFTQYDTLYGTLGYNTPAGTNFTMPQYITHDLVYGPGYLTGIGVQWVPTS